MHFFFHVCKRPAHSSFHGWLLEQVRIIAPNSGMAKALAWLTTTLEKLPTWPNSRLDELLPLRSAVSTDSI